MRRRRVRFTLRTMMITVAVVAVALALISTRWRSPAIIDPFDATEMLGPGQGQSPAIIDSFDAIEMVGPSQGQMTKR